MSFLYLSTFVLLENSALANPCSSIETDKPSSEIRKYQGNKVSFSIPANFRIISTQRGLMIHSPWSYEVYMCQIQSKYPSGEIEYMALVYTLPFNQANKITENLNFEDDETIETYYPGTSAKMYVYNTPGSPEARIIFIKKDKLVVIEIPMYSNNDGTPLTEVDDRHKSLVDLIMSTIQVN
ncbi:hypothetical protein H6F47_07305 [Sphaerospermopsis sp. FACHB-1094]|uniref:hypothetical protein n=1 Tax=Sphaerospermopsis sp. FACHB-1094 TaxID=2692861 RepID=UPI001681CA97|nr:hypothetical protein [Sphaerospermopsis sp. FACHB-1094]MBD2132247.1 hypothetical protein [Sphaerospermopsis sp. FACHB-1094]